MSSGKWYRDRLTGLPEGTDINQAEVQRAQELGCDVFCTRSFAAAAGYASARYFVREVLTGPGSLFHAMPIYDVNGRIVTWATRTESAVAGGQPPAVDIEVQRWPAGAQGVNQIYFDTARLLRATFLSGLVYNLVYTQHQEVAS